MSRVKPIDERYFQWLYAQVADEKARNPRQTHWLLCERLYKTPFEWYIRNDENRAGDGHALREEFLDETHEHHPDRLWMSLETSVFEMLISLARRASFQTDWGPDRWFWQFLENVELAKYNDDVYHDAIDDAVTRSLERIMAREYAPSGVGGFFPLRDPGRDQREVELWYQLSAYLLENIEF